MINELLFLGVVLLGVLIAFVFTFSKKAPVKPTKKPTAVEAKPIVSEPVKTESTPVAAPAKKAPKKQKKKKAKKVVMEDEESEEETVEIDAVEDFVIPEDPTISRPSEAKKKKKKVQEKQPEAKKTEKKQEKADKPAKQEKPEKKQEKAVEPKKKDAATDGFKSAASAKPRKTKADEPKDVEKIEQPTEKAPVKVKPVYYSDVEFWASKVKEMEATITKAPSKKEEAPKKAAKQAPAKKAVRAPAPAAAVSENPWKTVDAQPVISLDSEEFPSLDAPKKKKAKRATPRAVETIQSQEGSDNEEMEVEEYVPVTFSLKGDFADDDTIKVVGSAEELGSWVLDSAPTLSSHDGTYILTINVAKEVRTIDYKYACISAGGEITWEEGDNRSYEVGVSDHIDEWR